MVGGLPSLSLKEKVLLWLVWVEEADEEVRGGLAPTQAGIATSTGLSRGHVSRTLQRLVADEVLRTESVRVTGFSRVLKAYRVDEKGWAEYGRLRRVLLEARVPVGRDGNRQTRSLREVLPPPVDAGVLWQALEHLDSQGHLDETFGVAVRSPARRARFEVDLSDAPPRPSLFVGRVREVGWLRDWLDGPAGVCTVEAPGGLGKTSLLLEVLAAHPPQRHVLWVRIREWSTLDRFIEQIGGFVTTLGRNVTPPKRLDPESLRDHLFGTLKGLPVLLVIDDLQKAERPLAEAAMLLAQLAQRLPTLKLCLVGRMVELGVERLPPDVRCRLAPLGADVASHLLLQREVPRSHHGAIVAAAGGVPLFLEILAERHAAGGVLPGAEKRLMEDLGAGLSVEDSVLLSTAAAVRVPFSATLLQGIVQGVGRLDALATVGLVKRRGDGLYEMHDLVRKAFYDRLTAQRRKEIHAGLAEAYRPRSWPWTARGSGSGPDVTEFLHHLIGAGRRDEAVRWVLQNQSRIVTHARRLAERPLETATGRR